MTRRAGDEGIASGDVGFHGVLEDMKDQDVGLKGIKNRAQGLIRGDGTWVRGAGKL